MTQLIKTAAAVASDEAVPTNGQQQRNYNMAMGFSAEYKDMLTRQHQFVFIHNKYYICLYLPYYRFVARKH